MTRLSRTRENGESGAILIIFAVAMVVLIGMTAVAVDLSYGFVQNRRAQNATDFAAFAASAQLNSSSYCNGTATPSMPAGHRRHPAPRQRQRLEYRFCLERVVPLLDRAEDTEPSFTSISYPADPPRAPVG